MPRCSGFRVPRPHAALLSVLLAFTFSLLCGSLWRVEAQESGLAGRLQQAQAQVQQLQQQQQALEVRRQRLLDEQRKVLEKQAQLRKEIPEVQAALRKPLSPDQRDRQKCTLQELHTAQEQANQRQTTAQSELSQVQQQLTQVQQQLAQAQQLATQLAQQQAEQDAANQRRPDRLAQIMNAPAEPLDGLPLAPSGSGRRRVIILDNRFLYSIPPGVMLFTFDAMTVTTIVRRPGGGGGQFASDLIFTISDGSIQIVRIRQFRDFTTVAGLPAGGALILTLGPRRMNAEIASTFAMSGGNPTPFPMQTAPGQRSEGRFVIDVPDDPSIEPGVMYFIVSSE